MFAFLVDFYGFCACVFCTFAFFKVFFLGNLGDFSVFFCFFLGGCCGLNRVFCCFFGVSFFLHF